MVTNILNKLSPKTHRKFIYDYENILKNFRKRCIEYELHDILDIFGYETISYHDVPNKGDLLAVISKDSFKSDDDSRSVIFGQWFESNNSHIIIKCTDDEYNRLSNIMEEDKHIKEYSDWDFDIYCGSFKLSLINKKWYFYPNHHDKYEYIIYRRKIE